MVRSIAIFWKIGLAVVTAALSLWHLPASADEGRSEKVETRPQPVESKAVPVIFLPPADEGLFALRRPGSAKEPRVIPVQPVEDAEVAPPRPEPVTTPKDPAPVEQASLPKRPPQVALQPPAGAAPVQPRPEPAKVQKDVALVEIPALPERPPFRTILYDVRPVETEWETTRETASVRREQVREPSSFMAKVNSTFKPLADLWSGKRQAREADSPRADAASAKPDAERKPTSFLKSLQFW